MNREGTKRCPVLYGSEIWAILYVITKKMNNVNSNVNSNLNSSMNSKMNSDTKLFFCVKMCMVE